MIRSGQDIFRDHLREPMHSQNRESALIPFKYSPEYSDKIRIGKYTVSFVFQCRQKPGSYDRGQETMGFSRRGQIIDEFVSNECIEFYTKNNLDIQITGILVKIHAIETCSVCSGSAICQKCTTGIYRAAISCK